MKELREHVDIHIPTGIIQGHLFVGEDGLPEVMVGCEEYRPATFPAAWALKYVLQENDPILFAAWGAIEGIRQQIVYAQREAEQEAEDDAKERECEKQG